MRWLIVAVTGLLMASLVSAFTPEPPAPVESTMLVTAADARYDYVTSRVDRSKRDPVERIPKPEPLAIPEPPPPPPPPEPPSPAASSSQAPVAEPQTQAAPPSGGLPSLLLTIRANESGGNYSAYNATGCEGYGCGGAYQLHALYASEWAARAGYPGLSGQAQTWPASTQDAVALHLFYSTNPDGLHWCAWTDYC